MIKYICDVCHHEIKATDFVEAKILLETSNNKTVMSEKFHLHDDCLLKLVDAANPKRWPRPVYSNKETV